MSNLKNFLVAGGGSIQAPQIFPGIRYPKLMPSTLLQRYGYVIDSVSGNQIQIGGAGIATLTCINTAGTTVWSLTPAQIMTNGTQTGVKFLHTNGYIYSYVVNTTTSPYTMQFFKVNKTTGVSTLLGSSIAQGTVGGIPACYVAPRLINSNTLRFLVTKSAQESSYYTNAYFDINLDTDTVTESRTGLSLRYIYLPLVSSTAVTTIGWFNDSYFVTFSTSGGVNGVAGSIITIYNTDKYFTGVGQTIHVCMPLVDGVTASLMNTTFITADILCLANKIVDRADFDLAITEFINKVIGA